MMKCKTQETRERVAVGGWLAWEERPCLLCRCRNDKIGSRERKEEGGGNVKQNHHRDGQVKQEVVQHVCQRGESQEGRAKVKK